MGNFWLARRNTSNFEQRVPTLQSIPRSGDSIAKVACGIAVWQQPIEDASDREEQLAIM
jgi:hypothetical protein